MAHLGVPPCIQTLAPPSRDSGWPPNGKSPLVRRPVTGPGLRPPGHRQRPPTSVGAAPCLATVLFLASAHLHATKTHPLDHRPDCNSAICTSELTARTGAIMLPSIFVFAFPELKSWQRLCGSRGAADSSWRSLAHVRDASTRRKSSTQLQQPAS